MLRVFCSFVLFLISLNLLAQDRCGTVEYQNLLQQRHPMHETKDQFESWMQQRLKDKVGQKLNPLIINRIASGTYIVPVVIHVIHNGESIGTGTNISDAQILSQIDVLNRDFNRLNADTTKTLAEFKPAAGSFPITFVMAKQDPNGLATTGINRVKGTKTSWTIADNYTLKALSYWPAENYLNIWITNLSGGLLGYTQLPTSTTLQGLNDASTDRLTDGVVIDYQAYGNAQATGGSNFNLETEYNLGRTATHEVGHFFGLRHVWGDASGCTGTDYVADTPPQDTNFNGKCPSSAQVDCSGDAMFSNYLNYTDDACMNIFTKGQVSRMDVVINNSPRRLSLLSSLGSQAPAPVANDIELKTINAPAATACSGSLVPAILIRNFGSNTVTSSQINLTVNGSSVETKTFSGLNLSPNSETVVTFSSVVLAEGNISKFSFHVLQTNAGTDGRTQNDTISITTRVPYAAALPLIEPFNGIPNHWIITNPDGLITWQNTTIGSNKAMWLDFWDYENSGAVDRLITPVLDLTSTTTASVSFDYAYAMLSGGSNDRLRVLVTTDCNFDSSPVEIFNLAGSSLSSTSASGSAFTPTSTQWASKIFSLNQFLGQKIQIAFEGTNDYGNNLYLDNVSVLNTAVTAFALNGIVSPSPVSCQSSTGPVITVKNLGNTTINSFVVNTYVNNVKTSQQITGANIAVGTSKNVGLNATAFVTGNNSYSIAISVPNGVTTGISTKDSLSTYRYVNASTDIIPLRQTFDNNFDSWTSMSPQGGSTIWSPSTVTASKRVSLMVNDFSNTTIGEQAWLVSPVLDFSSAEKASVFFESSYGYRAPNGEALQIFSSTDCGQTFPHQLVFYTADDLRNDVSSSAWIPTQDNQWVKRYVNLDTLAGRQNVRLAFVATNANGNNLYLDNIEFFLGDDEFPPSVNGTYSVYGGTGTPLQVTFNLPERQLVHMQVYDVMGHVISDDLLPDTLNQTFTIDSTSHSRGIYIVRVQTQSPSTISSTKVLFGF